MSIETNETEVSWSDLAAMVQRKYLEWGQLVGEEVQHNRFGRGRLVRIKRLTFYVDFENRKDVSFSLKGQPYHLFPPGRSFRPLHISDKLRSLIETNRTLRSEELAVVKTVLGAAEK